MQKLYYVKLMMGRVGTGKDPVSREQCKPGAGTVLKRTPEAGTEARRTHAMWGVEFLYYAAPTFLLSMQFLCCMGRDAPRRGFFP
ncbi:MAG: hypothetical protein GX989_01040 [Firmicutes bacterium]|nr:hypothetical protein [Bacillota bacterium]